MELILELILETCIKGFFEQYPQSELQANFLELKTIATFLVLDIYRSPIYIGHLYFYKGEVDTDVKENPSSFHLKSMQDLRTKRIFSVFV